MIEDRGVSLAELVVTMSVGSVLLLALGSMFLNVIRGVDAMNARTAAVADARVVNDSITRSLRVAYPEDTPVSAPPVAAFTKAQAQSVEFTSQIQRGGIGLMKLAYSWNSDTGCIQEFKAPTGTSFGPPACLAKMAKTAENPLTFKYFTSQNVAIPDPVVSLSDRQRIAGVSVEVRIMDPKNPSKVLAGLKDFVFLDNIRDSST
ncbi:prepilin-type N-terminal cleavage/methylation domain-containing protein [Kineosporia babensis]|uniref:Prepilin-type N-terminal cleavage/methylation domain-containing protein n=1 Tax=Kineosporia babensis TaxID=499548 RepID=A0A9X1NMB5_9ACTN|nr:prepilin-type N-terminal cleavage/methylation domain-containing protein [Kineosporia babensis]MCD5316351.1 prepilin-type N-terminal cleavage/methylation domain-containing protein [Kineosporia babensis]